jgi:hypothetical protein
MSQVACIVGELPSDHDGGTRRGGCWHEHAKSPNLASWVDSLFEVGRDG